MNKKTLRSLVQKSGAFALSAVLLLGAGCSAAGAPYSDAASQDSPATVWYAPGTQKIRPDLDKESYADVQMPQLSVQSGRYEYESAQIIMSAERFTKMGLIWPLFSTALYFLVFVGVLSLLFGWIEKKMDYFLACRIIDYFWRRSTGIA